MDDYRIQELVILTKATRRGTRRGQSIADSLRIAIRGDDPTKDVASPESSPDSPDSPGSPDSTASSPSPTSTTFSTATSKMDAAPSTTQTVPPPAAATTTSALPPPPPAATTTTNMAPPPATTMSTSQATPPATTSIPSVVTSKTASGYFNHPELSTTSSGTLVRTSVISSSAPRTTATSPLPVLLNPAATAAGTGTADGTATQTPASPTSALTSSVNPEREVMSSSSSMALATSSAIAEAATASNSGGLGVEEVHDRHHLEAGTVAGIAIGSSSTYNAHSPVTFSHETSY